jgi:hypothetical protein
MPAEVLDRLFVGHKEGGIVAWQENLICVHLLLPARA